MYATKPSCLQSRDVRCEGSMTQDQQLTEQNCTVLHPHTRSYWPGPTHAGPCPAYYSGLASSSSRIGLTTSRQTLLYQLPTEGKYKRVNILLYNKTTPLASYGVRYAQSTKNKRRAGIVPNSKLLYDTKELLVSACSSQQPTVSLWPTTGPRLTYSTADLEMRSTLIGLPSHFENKN